jgi:hypothetical protein
MSNPLRADSVTRKSSTRAWVALPVLLVLLVYVWFISAGKWTSWPPTAIYNYYSKLASAFQHGHLYLDDKPSPELLALRDPYRKGARLDISYIWDASLYEGRYYLYWGPTPALIILPFKLAFSSEVGDNFLVFGFVSGLYLTLCALLLRIWDRFFRGLPQWLLLLAILLAGLVIPLSWMLNRPEVYEAAIAAGQLFLFLGLYFAYAALDREALSVWRLYLASAFWGLAVGSRTSQAFPIVFLILAAAAWLYVDRSRLKMADRWPQVLTAMLLPFAVSGVALCWYNWARFGSVTEFGYRYQLTLLPFPQHYSEIFSTLYILPNLYNYFLNPFALAGSFPFIKPQYGKTDFGAHILLPKIYFSEAVTGLVYTFPFLVLAVFPLFLALLRKPAIQTNVVRQGRDQGALRWLQFSLIGVGIVELASLLAFFFATMRYFADTVPALLLLSVLGFWEAYQYFTPRSVARVVFSGVSVILAAMTILTSTLLAISSYQERFLTTNPALMEQLNKLFSH